MGLSSEQYDYGITSDVSSLLDGLVHTVSYPYFICLNSKTKSKAEL